MYCFTNKLNSKIAIKTTQYLDWSTIKTIQYLDWSTIKTIQ